MLSLVKQIRSFTTSLNLSVPKPPNTPAGRRGFDIARTVIPQLNNPAVAYKMMLQKTEDVSSNRRHPETLARGEAVGIAAEHVCLCSGTQRRLENV